MKCGQFCGLFAVINIRTDKRHCSLLFVLFQPSRSHDQQCTVGQFRWSQWWYVVCELLVTCFLFWGRRYYGITPKLRSYLELLGCHSWIQTANPITDRFCPMTYLSERCDESLSTSCWGMLLTDNTNNNNKIIIIIVIFSFVAQQFLSWWSAVTPAWQSLYVLNSWDLHRGEEML